MLPAPPESKLRRQLNWLDAVAVALGAMIGAGVYIATGEAARVTGGSLLLAILIGGAAATFNALSAVELGVAFPRAGGAYEFGHRLVSPVVGFFAGWLFLFSGITAGATYALVFASYLNPILPQVPERLVGIGLTLAMVAINLAGVRPSARAATLLASVNVAVLAAFISLSATAFDVRRLTPFFIGGLGGLLQASALMFFAFAGYARPVTIVEEVKDPRRNLPRAVVVALSTAGALYLAVALVSLGAVGVEEFGASPAPLRSVLVAAGFPAGPALISLGAVLATTNVLLAEIWGLSRLIFAMSRRRDLPEPLGRLPTSGVPRNAILSVGAVVIVLTGLFDLSFLLQSSSMAILIYYAIMNLSALRLPESKLLYPRIVSAAGLGASALLALSLPLTTLTVVSTFLALGFVYFLVVRPRLDR